MKESNIKKKEETNTKKNVQPPIKKNKNKFDVWHIKIFFITFALSMFFGATSEIVLKNSGIIIAIVILIILFFIGVLFDMIGVACAACNLEDFLAMASRKEKGAKESIALIRNAGKVSNFCCDIVGDICGILSGAAGAAIMVKLMITAGSSTEIIIGALISSIIAAFMVAGKSYGKVVAINKAESIIKTCGKFLSGFTSKKN